MPLAQRDAELEPGEVRAEAAVDAAAEGEVPVGLAVPDELAGVRRTRPRRRWPRRAATITCSPSLTAKPSTSVSRVATRAQPMTGVSQRSISSTIAGTRVGLLDDPAPGVRVLGEVAEEAVERRRDRVEPGDEEQEADVEDLLVGEPVAVDLGVQEVAEEVVPLARPARSSMHLLEVGVDRVGGLLLVRLGLGVAELVADDLVGPDDAVLHLQEARELRPSAGRTA